MAKALKKERGYRITEFVVTVKHESHLSRRFIGMDLRSTLEFYDGVKATRVRVGLKPKGANHG